MTLSIEPDSVVKGAESPSTPSGPNFDVSWRTTLYVLAVAAVLTLAGIVLLLLNANTGA